MSNLSKGITFRCTRQENKVVRVHYTADPERGPAWVAKERKRYSSQGAWDREQEIIHEAGGGERLFAEVLNRWGDKIIIDSAEFRPSPHWKRIGGFDHGKANPTAALVGCVDFDGVLYITAEYYQPGFSPRQHRPNLEDLAGFLEAEVVADPSIFYKTQAQGDGSFKAISELYAEEGIANLLPAPANSELLGMERILTHWINLEDREPTLKIVCSKHQRDIQRPIYGLHNDGCPNLLWEPAAGQKGRTLVVTTGAQKSHRKNCGQRQSLARRAQVYGPVTAGAGQEVRSLPRAASGGGAGPHERHDPLGPGVLGVQRRRRR